MNVYEQGTSVYQDQQSCFLLTDVYSLRLDSYQDQIVVGQAACFFLAAQNNHSETISLESMFVQLLKHIDSQLLHLELNHFQYFIFYHKAHGLWARFRCICLQRWLHGFSLTLPFSLPHSVQFSLPSSTLPYHRPKTVSLLTNGIHSMQRGIPHHSRDSACYSISQNVSLVVFFWLNTIYSSLSLTVHDR